MNSAKRWLGAAAVVVALTGMAACTSGRSGSATGGTSDGLRQLESGSSANETLRPGVPSAQRGQYGESSGFQPGRLDSTKDTTVGSGAGGAAGAGTGGTMTNYTSSTSGYGAGGAAGTMGTYTSSTRGYGTGGAMTNYTSSTSGYGAGGASSDTGKAAPCP